MFSNSNMFINIVVHVCHRIGYVAVQYPSTSHEV